MDSSVFGNYKDKSIFHLRGVQCTFSYFILQTNSVDPDEMLCSAASYLGLCYLPLSHFLDARHERVNQTCCLGRFIHFWKFARPERLRRTSLACILILYNLIRPRILYLNYY